MADRLKNAGYESEAFDRAHPALEKLKSEFWDVILTDLRMPTMDGLQFLKAVKETSPDTEVLIMTAYGTVDTAVEAMRAGAAEYLMKPFQFAELEVRLQKLERILEERRQLRRFRELSTKAGAFHGIVGNSPLMRKLFEKINVFAPNPSPVLITGETGTGKELVARALHDKSGRGAFVAVPCAAIPRELAESELFGHEKGAFTSAVDRRRGRFEVAHRGTLFLDDIDDLPLEVQPKLLRALQEGRFERVGGEKAITVNVRVIAATKKDLLGQVTNKLFREDLFYRLNVLTLSLPPLRDRMEDLSSLVQHFLQELAKREGCRPKSLSAEALCLLAGHNWPGNIRELQAIIEYAHAEAQEDEILAGNLHFPGDSPSESSSSFLLKLEGLEKVSLKEMVEKFENEIIHWALAKADGNQQKAADFLGIPRTTLQGKISKQPPHTK